MSFSSMQADVEVTDAQIAELSVSKLRLFFSTKNLLSYDTKQAVS